MALFGGYGHIFFKVSISYLFRLSSVVKYDEWI